MTNILRAINKWALSLRDSIWNVGVHALTHSYMQHFNELLKPKGVSLCLNHAWSHAYLPCCTKNTNSTRHTNTTSLPFSRKHCRCCKRVTKLRHSRPGSREVLKKSFILANQCAHSQMVLSRKKLLRIWDGHDLYRQERRY